MTKNLKLKNCHYIWGNFQRNSEENNYNELFLQLGSTIRHTIFPDGQTGTLVYRKKFVPKNWCFLKKWSSLRICLGFHGLTSEK